MGILFITHKYPPAVGGMEKQSYQLINGVGGKIPSHSLIFDGRESIVTFFWKLKSRIKNILLQHPEITIIHLNDGLMASFCYLLGVDFYGRKVVTTLHGLDVVFPLAYYQNKLFSKAIDSLDGVICVSNATKEACLERKIPENKIEVIFNTIDDVGQLGSVVDYTEHFENKWQVDFSTKKLILAIGRPVRRKGFSWFCEQVIPLLDPSFVFVHVGNLPSERNWIFKILPKKVIHLIDLFLGTANDSHALIEAEKQNSTRIKLAGRLDDEQKNFLLEKASVVVMPNISVHGDMEGFGLVALEAALMGKTVLVSDMEGMKDAVHDGKNGFRISSGSSQEWAKAIVEKSMDNSFGNQARSYTLTHFVSDKMPNEYVEYFKKIENN